MSKCVSCEKMFKTDDMTYTKVYKGHVCPACIELDFMPCGYCDELVKFDDSVEVFYGKGGDEKKVRVCQDCLEEKFVQCVDCDTYHEEDMMRDYDGNNLCESCYEENYTTCDECDRVVKRDDMFYLESFDKELCDDCLDSSSYTRCDNCDEFFDRDEEGHQDPHTGYWYCDSCSEETKCMFCGRRNRDLNDMAICKQCYDKEFVPEASLTPRSEILQKFPDLEKRVRAAFEMSMKRREIECVEPGFANYLVNTFSGKAKINFDDLTYVDLTYDSENAKPLSKLPGSRIAREMFAGNAIALEEMGVTIAKLYNKKRDREGFLNNEVPYATELVIASLRYRFHKEKGRTGLRQAIEKLKGVYQFSNSANIIISDDPIDILMKSTGQTWEKISCEKYKTSLKGSKVYGEGGSYGTGIYSDIINSNLVVFLVGYDGVFHARIMLRWCVDAASSSKAKKFGIERVWYHGIDAKTDYDSSGYIGPGIAAKEVTKFIISILKKNGLYDYERCLTPYVYRGYSDVMSKGDTKIEYRKYDP